MILAIESSCDETAVALISDEGTLVLDYISSQVSTHAKYGGVVPELASRMHCESIHGLIETLLQEAGVTLSQLTAIAVTYGPGLEGALLVGMVAAKTLAMVLDIPLIPVNHMHGHLYAYWIHHKPVFPYLALIVSGGHTQLVKVNGHFEFSLLGETRDDAVGEAFDKVARLLGLGYPGGPRVEKCAQNGNSRAFLFPRAMIKQGYEFSFSGLKTAVLETTQKHELTELVVSDICASFQAAVLDILWEKSKRACNEYGLTHILITGGVAANQTLQARFKQESDAHQWQVMSVPPRYCTDNAAMIGITAYYMRQVHGASHYYPEVDQLVSPGILTCT